MMAGRDTVRRTDVRRGGRFLPFLAGIVFTCLVLWVGSMVYLRYGHPPVAVADKALPFERQVAHTALAARVARETAEPPFGTSEDVYESGAKLYVNHCAGCHGLPDAPSGLARTMYPNVPQLWRRHAHGAVVGVSDDPAGETFWKIEHGIRLSGMPAFGNTLSAEQEWQIALLLKNADQPLPDPVKKILAASGR